MNWSCKEKVNTRSSPISTLIVRAPANRKTAFQTKSRHLSGCFWTNWSIQIELFYLRFSRTGFFFEIFPFSMNLKQVGSGIFLEKNATSFHFRFFWPSKFQNFHEDIILFWKKIDFFFLWGKLLWTFVSLFFPRLKITQTSNSMFLSVSFRCIFPRIMVLNTQSICP